MQFVDDLLAPLVLPELKNMIGDFLAQVAMTDANVGYGQSQGELGGLIDPFIPENAYVTRDPVKGDRDIVSLQAAHLGYHCRQCRIADRVVLECLQGRQRVRANRDPAVSWL